MHILDKKIKPYFWVHERTKLYNNYFKEHLLSNLDNKNQYIFTI